MQNFPNPFNPSTTFKFALPKTCFVNLTIYNENGQKIAITVNSQMHSGIHQITFNASNLPSGVYYCRMQAGEFIAVKKMLLLK